MTTHRLMCRCEIAAEVERMVNLSPFERMRLHNHLWGATCDLRKRAQTEKRTPSADDRNAK